MAPGIKKKLTAIYDRAVETVTGGGGGGCG
jgi:hypothetical protein